MGPQSLAGWAERNLGAGVGQDVLVASLCYSKSYKVSDSLNKPGSASHVSEEASERDWLQPKPGFSFQ